MSFGMKFGKQALMAGLVSVISIAGAQRADADEIRYATLVSNGHTGVQDAVLPFFEQVSKATNGELTGRVFPSGQLLNARGTLKGINEGVADAGLVIPHYAASQLPHVLALADMIMIGEDPLAVAAALNETILFDCETCLKEYEAQNTFPLVSYSTTSYVLQCNKPLNSKEDLKGLRVRSTGMFSSRLSALGALPTNLASSESAQALQRGQVDCVLGPMSWLKAYGLQGSVSHIIDVPLGMVRGLGLFVINKNKWTEMPKAQRQAMLDAAPGMLAGVMFGQPREDREQVIWAKENNVDISEGSDELRASLTVSDKDDDILAERAEKLGVKNIDELVATFKKNLEKWQGIVAKTGDDKAAYIDAVKREIYSRL